MTTCLYFPHCLPHFYIKIKIINTKKKKKKYKKDDWIKMFSFRKKDWQIIVLMVAKNITLFKNPKIALKFPKVSSLTTLKITIKLYSIYFILKIK